MALDATYAAHPNPTGIGIYSKKLIQALARRIPAEPRSRNRLVLAFRPGPFAQWAWRRKWPAPFHIAPLLDPWLSVPRATLFHGLNQRLPERRYALQVVTLHERFPPPSDAYSTEEFRRFITRRIEKALQGADRVIAVSHSVRRHLVDYDSSLANKTDVVHHGVDCSLGVDSDATAIFLKEHLNVEAGAQFFLNVGAVQTRKNIAGIVMAMQPLRDSVLVLAGADGYGAEEIRSLIRREGMQDRVRFLGHVGHDVLSALYSSASALVFPSFEEAFGLPILEAMSYGLPVITSNVAGMPEVAGDAAILVDPHSTEEIRDAMRRIAEDKSLASDMADKGRRRAAQFTWDRCAEQTWAVYEELLREA